MILIRHLAVTGIWLEMASNVSNVFTRAVMQLCLVARAMSGVYHTHDVSVPRQVLLSIQLLMQFLSLA